MKKVFVCFTPLHVLIAKKIIEIEYIKDFVFIYFTDIDNEKHRYYYNKLKLIATESYFVILKKRLFIDMLTLHKLKKKITNNSSFKNFVFYTGKIKSFHVRYLMYLTNYNSFITFDDGTGNISREGYFYDENERFLFKIFFSLIDKRLIYKNIKNSMKLHYTIYNLPNVFPRSKYIDIFNKSDLIVKKKKENKKGITILLTNAFAEDGEMKLEDEKELYYKIINYFNVTHICKHPREKFQKLENISVIELKSNKIAEELIFELHKDYQVTVIGIYSTTLFNLASIKGIKLINVYAKLKKPTDNIRKLLSRIKIERDR